MYALKGFVSHASFADNDVAKVAKIGELSSYSASFSREKGHYTTGNAQDMLLTSFLSAMNGALQPIPGALVEHVLKISKFIYDKTLNSSQQIYADELYNELIATFAGEAENFTGGAIVTDGRYWMPEWVSWKYVKDNAVGDNEIRVWFVDESFAIQYDEYQIVIVPPIENLNDFFKTGTEVENAVRAVSDQERFQRIQIALGKYPNTITASAPFDYNDPYVASHKVPTNWTILMYGAAANNVDLINKALEDYILANSDYERGEWVKLFPDIFKHTEFILIPMWDQFAFPQKETQEGAYSTVVNMRDGIGRLKTLVQYLSAHIDYFGASMGHAYKGLAILSIGSPDNRNNQYRLTDVFPDYFPVSSTSLDFNRMSKNTRDFMLILEDMLLWAERMAEYSSIPTQAGYTKTVRNGVLYLVRNYKDINYLVAAKKNFPVT